MIFRIILRSTKIAFEFSYEDREFRLHFKIGRYTLIEYDKSFARTFRCVECKKEVLDDEQITRLCDEHRDHFIQTWEERWHRGK